MSVLLDARPIATAVKAAIKANLGPRDVFEYGDVPGTTNGPAGTLPDIFVLISLERRYNPALRLSAQSGMTGWRLSVRSLGRTVDEARWAMFQVSKALNERPIPVGEGFTSPIQLETDEAPTWDDGRHVGRSDWTFSHANSA